MQKEFTCVVCPNGCNIVVEQYGEEFTFSGAGCKRGETYAKQELVDPRRTISTLVAIEGRDAQLLSVRLTDPIPLKKIPEAVKAIHALQVKAPVASGEVLIHHILGENSDVIATCSIEQ